VRNESGLVSDGPSRQSRDDRATSSRELKKLQNGQNAVETTVSMSTENKLNYTQRG